MSAPRLNKTLNSRAVSVAAALALASSFPAPAAGQVSSAPLAQVDPWGVGWLGRNDSPLPNTIWANTDAETLAPLLAATQPLQLSPATRAAVRRIALSSARSPAGGGELIPERLRILEQLGETDRSIDLRKRFPAADWGKSHERLASEFDLVHSRATPACGRAADKRADDPDWMAVRAFCFALAGDFTAATLMGENLPAGPDGKSDAWLLAAISAMDPAVKSRPQGRYTNAFETAVSVAAKLSVQANAFASMPADIAAAVVLHPNATLEQKRAALRPALGDSRIRVSDVLAVLTAKDEAPAAASRRGAPRADFLAMALAAAANADAEPEAKSAAIAAALKAADTQTEFHLTAIALRDAIGALPKDPANAATFARAALALDDARAAADWRNRMDEKADPWAAARIDLMLSFAGANGGKPGEILDRLIAAIPPAPETPARTAATPAARQLDLRRIENTRALFLFAGTGRALDAHQRALLATQRSAGRGVSDAAIARIAAATAQKANGEAALAALSLMGSDTSALSFAGLSDLLSQLRAAGFEKEADAIALESLQVWKAL